MELGNSWEPVARRLKFKDAEVTAIHKDNEEYAKKALKMLFGGKGEMALKQLIESCTLPCLINW